MTKERLQNTVKVHRAMRDWTQARLAEYRCVTRKSINASERGHFVPSTVLALRLTSLFECRVEDLFSLPPDCGRRYGWPGPCLSARPGAERRSSQVNSRHPRGAQWTSRVCGNVACQPNQNAR